MHPIHAWINVTSRSLESLRIALITHHRDDFEQAALRSFDPSSWMARAVAENITALIHTLDLYEQAVKRALDDDDVDF